MLASNGTLDHVIDEWGALRKPGPADFEKSDIPLVVSGYDVAAAQTVQERKTERA